MTRRVIDIEEDITDMFLLNSIPEVIAQLKEMHMFGYVTLDYKLNKYDEWRVMAQKWRDETEYEARLREEHEMIQDLAEMGT